MREVVVREVVPVIQLTATTAAAVGVDLLAGERAKPFDRVVAVVLGAQDRGEAVVAEVVRAGEITVIFPGRAGTDEAITRFERQFAD